MSMSMKELIDKYGPLENAAVNEQGRQTTDATTRDIESEQLILFENRCNCGQTATLTQETIFGEEHYCDSCYNVMTEEKKEVEQCN